MTIVLMSYLQGCCFFFLLLFLFCMIIVVNDITHRSIIILLFHVHFVKRSTVRSFGRELSSLSVATCSAPSHSFTGPHVLDYGGACPSLEVRIFWTTDVRIFGSMEVRIFGSMEVRIFCIAYLLDPIARLGSEGDP